ncbi:mucin-12-like [Megalobrama amblycephala]|uniref:mucin-12-like n=1 Tax=Megalobrama amblycephala TaxID=75352 RepID=UPI002013EFDE|nr:mucin-12-like [Megalobrama amblycephala]
MYFFAMDLGWNRVPILLILLIFWKHAVGHKGWSSEDFHSQRKGHVHKFSPRGAQSSVLEAPVTGSIPFEEVASNVLAGKSLNANRSRFSLSHQYVKGGVSSSYESMSHTLSAPSASVSGSMVLPQNQHGSDGITSLLQLQGSFSPSVQDIANQTGPQLVESSSPLSAQSSSSTGSSANSLSKFTYTSQGSSRPQKAGSSSQLVSTHGVSGLLLQSLPSSTASQNIPGSSAYAKLAASPLGVSQSTSGQSSYSQYTSGSQSRAGTQLAASRQYVPTSFQPEVTTSQYASKLSLGAKVPVLSWYYPATQSGSSLSQSQPFQMWQPSTSTTKGLQASSTVASQGFQTSGASQSISQSHSRLYSLSSASTDPASTLQLQGTSSQYAPAALDSKVLVYSQATPSGSSSSLSQPSQLKLSTSRWSQGFQTSGTVTSQSSSPSQGSKAPSRFSSLTSASTGQFASTQTGSPFTDGSSLLLQGTSSQYTPAAKVPVYNRVPPSGSSLSLSQPSQLKPSTSRWSQGFPASGAVASQGFQTIGTATSQSSSLSQGSKAPSRFSTLTSASPGQFASTQTGSTFTDVSSLPLQGTSSQYTPAALAAKVPVYNRAAPSGSSFSLSQPSQLKPWDQLEGFQASGTVVSQGSQTSGTATSQSSSPSQGSKAPSRYSSLTSASTGQFASTQTGSTFTDGSSLLLQGTSSQYTPAALAAKVPVYNRVPPGGSSLSLSQPSQLKPSASRWSQGFPASGTLASQGFQTFGTATSQSSSLSQGSKAPSRISVLTPAASPGQLASTQDGSGRSSGLSSQSQSASSQYRPGSPAYVKYGSSLDVSSQSTSDQSAFDSYASSSQSRTGTQLAGSSRYVPTQTGSTFTDGFSLQLQGASSQYAPALAAKVPVSSQAAPSGYSSSQPSQWQPSTSRLSQGFQVSGTVASQSSALSQDFKAPSRFSTLTSAASPGQFASTQTGIPFTDGSPLPLQGTSSQYTPAALVAKVPVYNRAPSGSSSSLSQPSQLKPSSWSQGFQASGTATSQSSSSSQGSKASRFFTLTSAASPGQFASTQEGNGRYSGLSSQSQSASSQYTPAALVAKVPVYNRVPPSGSSLSLSQPSKLKPSTSRWPQGFQASGTTVSQSSSLFQDSKAPSRISVLTPAASPGQFASTQEGSGRYSGLSSQSQSASSQYRPGSPAYIKYGSSLDVSSQSTSDQSAFDLYASSSQSASPTQLAGSSRYVPTQTRSTFTDGSSLQLQGISSLYAPAVVAKVPVYSQFTPSGSLLSQLLPSASSWSQGFQASGTAVSQSSSSPQTPQFSSASVMPALSPPVDSVAQSSQSFSSVIRRNTSPGLFASVQHPTDSMTSSLGSNVQAASQGMFSGQSSDSTSVISSRYASYDQKPLSNSRPSKSSSASGRYSSSVKG